MSDYDRVAKAVDFIVGGAERQPRLDEVAAHVHLSPHHFQRLFSRWVGVTPKRFLQVLTVERAKVLLEHPGMPLLEVADAVGLSSGSRLYEHFVHLEGVTPAEFRRVGRDLEIRYGEAETPFGRAFLASTERGVCKLAFVDGGDFDARSELEHDWPEARLVEDPSRAAGTAARIFDPAAAASGAAKPLSLLVRGTNFQISVWRALLQIPPGGLASYGDVAAAIGRPDAARAVGTAVGANRVAFLIPCHRVIRQGGGLGGYRWGTTRKHAMHAFEAARFG
jgi:AraC family transcriptional regulator of adaptative response/methylated-DNA-[protein]-cysteine methyltransferase